MRRRIPALVALLALALGPAAWANKAPPRPPPSQPAGAQPAPAPPAKSWRSAGMVALGLGAASLTAAVGFCLLRRRPMGD